MSDTSLTARMRLHEWAWAVERDGYLTLAESQAIGRPHPDDWHV